MSLTRKQKRKVLTLYKKENLDTIIEETGADQEDIIRYLKKRGKKVQIESSDSSSFHTHILKRISLINKSWLYAHKWIIVGLGLMSFLVYANAITHEFVSDDLAMIRDPRLGSWQYVVHDPRSLLRTALYAITFNIFGVSSAAFRISNILFHVVTVQLVFLFVWLLTNNKTAVITAGIFAVHPLFVESITWISGGVYPQYSMVVIAALIAYIFGLRDKRFYFVAIFLFMLSLLISEKSIVLPFLFVLFDIAVGRFRKHIKYYAVIFGILGLFGVILAFHLFERMQLLSTSYYLESGFDNPFLLIPVAISNYIFLLFWPQRLSLYQTEVAPTTIVFVVEAIITLVYLGLVAYFYKKDKAVFFFLSFFIIALLPFLTPFRISWVVAERYAYLASIGVIAAFSYGIVYLSERYQSYRDVILSLVVLTVIALSIRTFVRNQDWKNEDTLWVATVKSSPSSPNAYNNIGDVYIRAGDLEKAAQAFQTAIQIKPNYADAMHNLGNTYQKMERYDDAYAMYEEALKINPNLWQSHVQIASIHSVKGESKQVEQRLMKALEISPNNPDVLVSFGIYYSMIGDNKKAIEQGEKALMINPNNTRAKELLMQLQQM